MLLVKLLPVLRNITKNEETLSAVSSLRAAKSPTKIICRAHILT